MNTGRLDKIGKKIDSYFIQGCIIGAIAFIILYGVNVLDFTYDGWLIGREGGVDLTQHYLGWKFYRRSEWSFPIIGTVKELLYPFNGSIVFMDVIPLFAVFFKLFSSILPETFQYFGLWGIMSFMLQGGIGALILKKYEKSYILVGIYTIFLIWCPVMIFRMYAHSALAGQWLLLYGIWIWINKAQLNQRSFIKHWCIACGLAAAVHPYLTLMTGVLMLGCVIQEYVDTRNLKKVMITLFSAVGIAGTIFILLGGLMAGSGSSGGGLGIFSMNINALINPQGYSTIFNDLPSIPGQYEGIMYMGAGLIILGVVAVIIIIKNLLSKILEEKQSSIEQGRDNFFKRNLGMIIVCIILTILALSPKVSIGERVLIDYLPILPNIVCKLLSIFRASGRLFWPIYYLIIIGIFKVITQTFKSKRISYVLISGCLLIQLIDLSGVLIEKHNQFATKKVEYVNALQSKFWTDVVKTGKIKHIQLLPASMEEWELYSEYALENDLTVSMVYVARHEEEKVKEQVEQYIEQLKHGIAQEDTLFIIKDIGLFNEILSTHEASGLAYLVVDNQMVIFNRQLLDISGYDESMGVTAKGYVGEGKFIGFTEVDDKIVLCDLNVPNIDNSFNVAITSDYTQYEVSGNNKIKLKINVKNNTPNLFSSTQSKVVTNAAYHLLDEEGNMIQFDGQRTPIEILPYEEEEIELEVVLPEESGHYIVRPDVVCEGVAWMGDHGASTTDIKVIYEAE